MSHPTPYDDEPVRRTAARELIGLLLLVLGVAGLDTVLFLAHPLAGFAGLAALVAGVGAWLSLSEV